MPLSEFSPPLSSTPFPVSIDPHSIPFLHAINFLAFTSDWEYVVFDFVFLGYFTEQKILSSMHIVANEGIAPLFIAEKPSTVYAC